MQNDQFGFAGMNMKYKLKDIFDLQMGKTPSRNNTEYWNTKEHKWISIADLTKTGKYISETKECLSDCAIDDSGIKVIPANTVVMSFKLSIGKTAITAEDMYSNEAIMAFHDKHVVEILPEYIYYMFKYKNWDEGSNKAVMGKTLNKATLSEVEIDICSLEEQREIVKVLDKMMTVLGSRETELSLLDDLIKARFVELFGDENNSKKWDVVNVEDVADVQVGVVIKPSQYYTDEENGIRAFRSLNIGAGYIKDTEWVYFTEEGHQKNSKSILKVNDLLIVRSGAPGTACVVTEEYAGYNAIDIIIAHPNCEKINPYYLCTFTNMPHGKKQIEEGTGGAAQQHFNVGKYNKLQVMLPPKELQDEFVDFVTQVDKSKVAVQKALDETQTLFDSLMQEYFG
ncbi:restriction endonuclease subunit S [Blautia glucerasea]|uniref:restriction endonuclease subunit S n=1 Tax=Blautia glucerasea TaxID=536633 RepID=UPI001570D205|nr:restriction endonuclease subunit S [Blautia glucerasea]